MIRLLLPNSRNRNDSINGYRNRRVEGHYERSEVISIQNMVVAMFVEYPKAFRAGYGRVS